MRKRCLSGFIVFISLLLLASCGSAEKKQSKTYYTFFDTVCTITGYADETETQFEKNCEKAAQLLEKLNKELDIYHEYYQVNNLFTLNKNAGSFVELPDETVEFLHYCVDMYYLTQGYTDISMGSVLSLWHESRTSTGIPPTDNDLEKASHHKGINLLEFDGNKVKIADPSASIDAGSIAKGWAAEKVAELLLGLGCNSYVIDLGGNIRIVGSKPNGEAFSVGIRNPSLDGTLAYKYDLTDTSCVTSGSYERYFTYNGENYCHIINPYTMQPAADFLSVTVITRDSAKADALSTALFCMPYEEGRKLADSLPDVQVMWILLDGTLLFK